MMAAHDGRVEPTADAARPDFTDPPPQGQIVDTVDRVPQHMHWRLAGFYVRLDYDSAI